MIRLWLHPLTVSAIGLAIGLGPGPGQPDSRPLVYSSLYPLTCFAERIGGDLIRVVCPVPPGDDPASWKPDRETIQAMQQADLVLVNGARFERWVEQVSLPRATLVRVSKPFRGQFLKLPSIRVHSHGPDGAHAHEGLDGHTWLDPELAAQQADQVRQALLRLLPERAETIERNHTELLAELERLDGAFRAVTERIGATPLLASHPAYQYVVRRYGWNLHSLDLAPKAGLDEDGRSALKLLQGEHPARIVLFEVEPNAELRELLRSEFGLKCVLFSPCESFDLELQQQGLDYYTVMAANLERLSAALERSDG